MTRKVMGALVAGLLGSAPAFADTIADTIVNELKSQGFDAVSTERTWLGRTRIVASGSAGEREIIVNPNTGEILRDLWLVKNEDRSGGLLGDGTRSRLGSDDDDDDDNGGRSGGSGGDDNGGNSGGGRSGDGGGDDNGGNSD